MLHEHSIYVQMLPRYWDGPRLANKPMLLDQKQWPQALAYLSHVHNSLHLAVCYCRCSHTRSQCFLCTSSAFVSLNVGAVATSILQTDTRKSTLPHQSRNYLDLDLRVRYIRIRAPSNSRSTVLTNKTETAGRSLAQSSPPSRRSHLIDGATLEAPTSIRLASRKPWLCTSESLTLRRHSSQRL